MGLLFYFLNFKEDGYMVEIALLKSLEKEGLITKEELNKAIELLRKKDNKIAS